MQELNISTGIREYNINGKCTVLFNPTDPNFVGKIFETFDQLDKEHDEYSRAIQNETDGARVFEIAREMDRDMRARIDDVLGPGVCDQIFGNISVYAAGDGLPLWANLMLAIIDEMDDAFAREKKASNPRIKKYTEKYSKRK